LRRLIIRPGAIGDTILALPAMESLRADYTEVWVASQNVPLIRFADRALSIASTGLDSLGIPGIEAPARTLERLRGFDSIVSWYGANREEFREAVSQFPFTFLRALPEEGAGLHATDYFLRQVETWRGGTSGANRANGGLWPGSRASLIQKSFSQPVAPSIPCRRGNGGFVAMHPFSGSAKKNWPLERFRAVAAKLRGPVEWCAGPEEKLDDAVRIADLYELSEWLASARLYIGNDSGITHLAAAVGTPAIALFGPSDPAVWGPRGERVRILKAMPMEDLQPEAVVAAAEAMEE
jgi:hypothetical protein